MAVPLFLGLVQLGLAVGELGVGLLLGLLQLVLGLGDGVAGLVIPQGGTLPGEGLELGLQLVDEGLVRVAVGLQLRRPGGDEVGVGVVVHGEGLDGQDEVGVHTAGAQGGGPPLNGEVQGRVGGAHDGDLLHGQGVGVVPVPGVQGDGVPDGQPAGRQEEGLCETFVLGLGEAALQQGGLVDVLRPGVGEELHHHLLVGQGDQGVHRVSPLGGLDAILLPQGGDVVLGEAQGGGDAQVHQLLGVEIGVGGGLHVRSGDPEPRQETHRQGGEDQQGEEPGEGVADLPQGVGHQAVVDPAGDEPVQKIRKPPEGVGDPFHSASSFPYKSCSDGYHSISSTGRGWGFKSSCSTWPFFTWMTLSAMGAMAVLWVMTTTVIPWWRQVSWRSLRICLPVT